MRHRWLSILFVILLFGLSQVQAQAQAIGEERSFYVYRLEIKGCANGSNKISTGFRVEGEVGIITALHAVVDCEFITAYSDDIYSDSKGVNNRFENLEIRKVDIEHDVALLWRDDLDNGNVLAGGLKKYSSDFPKKKEDLYVTGYPDGVSKQDFLLGITVTDYDQLTYRIPDNQKPAKDGLLERKSPNLKTKVLYLQASVRPGHSGAPLLTSDKQVYGVINGGLDLGRTEVSWAIRLSDIEWEEVEAKGVAEELKRLADPDLASSLSFSSTFPNYDTGVDMQDLSSEAVRSYRANTNVFISGTDQGKDIESWLFFETYYNADGDQRSVIGAENTQFFEQEQQQIVTASEEAYLIFSNEGHYLSLLGGFQDNCWELDELPESIADFVEITDDAMSPTFVDDALTLVSHLGTEEINGEETNHYLLTEPIPLDEASKMVGLELWVTVDSKQLKKITFEIASTEDSSTAEQPFVGNTYVDIEYSDINTDLTVDLPRACQNVSSAVNVNSALDNGQAMIMEPIPVEHNVSGLEGSGMLIKPTLTVNDLAEGPGFAIVRIFDEFGMPLLTYFPETGALDGIYQAQTPFIPPFESEEFEIFVPYEALPLLEGVQDLKYRVFVYDISTKAVLAESDSYDFSLWQQTDEAGNRNWLSDNYSGLSGITVAGQTEVSPFEQDVGNFLSHAFEAETWAYWDEDPSVAEPYFGGNALLSLQESIEDLQQQGLVLNAEFDEQNSFIVNMNVIDDNTVEVDVCESWRAGTVSDKSDQPDLEEQLIPQTVTLEKNSNSWWSITDVVVYSGDNGLCELGYFGLSGMTVAGQTEVSPFEQYVGNFLSLAFEAETWAYWDEDPSVAEPYFGGNALLSLQENIEDLQQQGLVLYAEFDEQNSFIVSINEIDDNTVEVDVCESWRAGTVSDKSDQPDLEEQLIPQTVTLEKNSGSWWSIIEVDYPDNEMCVLE